MAILTGQAARDYIASGKPYKQLTQQQLTQQQVAQPANRSMIDNILLGLTSGVRGLGSQATQLVGGLGEIAQGYMSGKTPQEIAASTDINKYAGAFLTPEETVVAKQDPLRFGTGTALENLTFALPVGRGVGGMAKMGAVGGGMASLGTGLKQEDLSGLPSRVISGAALGGALGGGLGLAQKELQKLQNVKLQRELKGVNYEQLTPDQLQNMTFDDIMAKYNEMPKSWKAAFEMQNRGRGFRFEMPTKKTGEFQNVLRNMEEDMVAIDVANKITGNKMGVTGRGILETPEMAGQIKQRIQGQWGNKVVGTRQELVDAAIDRGMKEFGKTRQEMADAIARVRKLEGGVKPGQAGLDRLNNKQELTMGDLAGISSSYKSDTWDQFIRIGQSGSNFSSKDQMTILAKQLMGQEARNLISVKDPLLDVPYRAWEAWATQNQNIIGNLNQQASNLLPAGRGGLATKIQSPFETGLGTLGRNIFSGQLPQIPKGVTETLGVAGTIAPRAVPMIQGQEQMQVQPDQTLLSMGTQPDQDIDRQAILSQLLSQGYSINEAISLAKYLYPESKGTDYTRKISGAETAAISALQTLQGGGVNTGLISGRLQDIGGTLGMQGTTDVNYRSQLALARTLLRTALLGSQMSESELASIEAFIPSFYDSPEQASTKLQQFISLLGQLKQSGGTSEQADAYNLLANYQ